MSHFIEKCLSCKKVVAQCRCSDKNKVVRWTTCSDCAKLCKEIE